MAVVRQNGEQLGYMPTEQSRRIFDEIEQGYRFGVYVVKTTGGTSRKETMGVNLLILVADPGIDDASIAAYFNSHLATDPEFLLETGATSVKMPTAQQPDFDSLIADELLATDPARPAAPAPPAPLGRRPPPLPPQR